MQPTLQAHETLRRLAAATDPIVACRAVLTLHASGGCDQTYLRGLLSHSDEHLRAWGVRLLGDDWPIDGVIGPATISKEASARVAAACDAVAADLHKLAMNDPSGLVRLAVASTLQRMPADRRADLAAALMTRSEDADDHNLPLLMSICDRMVVLQQGRKIAEGTPAAIAVHPEVLRAYLGTPAEPAAAQAAPEEVPA